MKILVIGQCTLHWGRMEFGNIGNYYIMEPFFRLLHKEFPNATISTTFQMSNRFCIDENIESLPMELYYSWENDLEKANHELTIAEKYLITGIPESTPYIDLVKEMDLVIDFSGDIWGDNADFLGKDRFLVGLIKDRVTQIYAKKTVMIAGSPGPFKNKEHIDFAKEVYKNFDLVTNREFISKGLLNNYGFDTSKTYSLACPAFRFEPASKEKLNGFRELDNILSHKRKSIGFLICGWNFTEGPFDKWPRPDSDYLVFAEAIEEFSKKNKDVDIYLMSHSNGFPLPPETFQLIHGRDYPIMKQLKSVLDKREKIHNVHLLNGVYDAWQTKSLLGQFDMVVSGRVHAAVGAMSQCVPTVVIDYGHEPKAHKLRGFAAVAGQESFVASPDKVNDLIAKIDEVWSNIEDVKNSLEINIPKVQSLSSKNFEMLKTLF
ncbi:polysaccharide pyruvyl transferase family protein [Winogradskyella bathintestinalis]|uniref:Polysaccharide pyruvyl transferase family protein n=1 Tax=Winogradskyella bathintestinalis TaxID=3035208 RepID=A0ABT7ZTT6_9FLAO|nr:polysaccharide pyruvyl transferase family protein [Winogradskyella bathintestinalis]MDN3492436.1 polysaccharide pyruvyl transferase family protein [Winogradskyella bathintestinalis]